MRRGPKREVRVYELRREVFRPRRKTQRCRCGRPSGSLLALSRDHGGVFERRRHVRHAPRRSGRGPKPFQEGQLLIDIKIDSGQLTVVPQ